jgi:ribosome biogenesis GTPase A
MGRIIVAVFFKLTTLNVFKKIDASENIFENSEDLISFGNKNLKAVQIFSVNGNKLEANWQNINNIFKSNKDVADYPLKIIVVCGQPRKGKSTICNLLYNKTWTNDSNFTGSFGNVEQNG